MDMPFINKKKQQGIKDKEDQKLKDDGSNAMKEMQPILDKYNLVIVGIMQVYSDGFKAGASLARKPEKEKKSDLTMTEITPPK